MQEHAQLVRALGAACGDRDRASEAVQDAFVHASRHWDKVREYDDPAAWVRRVAVNRLADQRRSDRRRRTGTDAESAMASGSAPWAVSEIDPGHEDLAAAVLDLRTGLAQLPAQQRLALTLHYIADLSVDQVATVLDIPAAHLKSIDFRAQGRCKRRNR